MPHVLDVAAPADDRPPVRVGLEGGGGDRLPEEPPGAVLSPFQLAPHHRHLGVEVRLVDAAVHHPVGLDLHRELQPVGGDRRVVVRPVVVGARVEGAPLRNSVRGISPSRYCLVPLKSMCSSRWETPVIPVCSLRDPARYQTLKLTTGAFRTSLTRRVRPFGSTVSWTPAVRAEAGGSAARAAPPAVASRPSAARSATRRRSGRAAGTAGARHAPQYTDVVLAVRGRRRAGRARRSVVSCGGRARSRPAHPHDPAHARST